MLKFSYSQIKNSRNPLTHVDENVELSKEFLIEVKNYWKMQRMFMLPVTSSMMNLLLLVTLLSKQMLWHLQLVA